MQYQMIAAVLVALMAGTACRAEDAKSPTAPTAKWEWKGPGLLEDGHGGRIHNPSEWATKREEIVAKWNKVLGPFPKRKPELEARVLATERLADFNRQYIEYQVLEGTRIDGYLLTPAGVTGRCPAVVVFHPTTPFHARGVAGLEPSYPQDKWQAVQLVRAGFVVWCPRNYINTAGADWLGNAKQLMAANPGWTGMGRMTWDAIRAVDFLETRPEVDPARIGCLGHSLGAKVVLYAMAFDGRYRAGVFSEGGIGLRFSNWDAEWYLGKQIRAAEFGRDHHEVLSLIAPRPFLVLAGDSADSAESDRVLQEVRPVYELFGARDRLRFFNHHQGHQYPPEARAVAEQFLKRELRK